MAEPYKDAYEKGYTDGKTGKERKAVANLKELFRMSLHSQTYESKFFEGYNDGYSKGIHDRMKNG